MRVVLELSDPMSGIMLGLEAVSAIRRVGTMVYSK